MWPNVLFHLLMFGCYFVVVVVQVKSVGSSASGSSSASSASGGSASQDSQTNGQRLEVSVAAANGNSNSASIKSAKVGQLLIFTVYFAISKMKVLKGFDLPCRLMPRMIFICWTVFTLGQA